MDQETWKETAKEFVADKKIVGIYLPHKTPPQEFERWPLLVYDENGLKECDPCPGEELLGDFSILPFSIYRDYPEHSPFGIYMPLFLSIDMLWQMNPIAAELITLGRRDVTGTGDEVGPEVSEARPTSSQQKKVFSTITKKDTPVSKAVQKSGHKGSTANNTPDVANVKAASANPVEANSTSVDSGKTESVQTQAAKPKTKNKKKNKKHSKNQTNQNAQHLEMTKKEEEEDRLIDEAYQEALKILDTSLNFYVNLTDELRKKNNYTIKDSKQNRTNLQKFEKVLFDYHKLMDEQNVGGDLAAAQTFWKLRLDLLKNKTDLESVKVCKMYTVLLKHEEACLLSDAHQIEELIGHIIETPDVHQLETMYYDLAFSFSR